MKALVVEDTLTSLAAVTFQLERMGITPVSARDGASGLEAFDAHKPDLVLLDIILPGIDGYEVARRIRAREKEGEWTPIIFLTAKASDQDLEAGIAAGGDDYLTKPVSEIVLRAKLNAMQRIMQMRYSLLVVSRKLAAANQELQRLSSLDGLTGISNRRQFDETLDREWRRAVRGRHGLTLIFGDVDFFKQYNDVYGHQAGDECLKSVARLLGTQAKRPGDLIARYGGEEFAAILPDTDGKGAILVGESMRRSVEREAILHSGSSVAQVVTISVGVAVAAPKRGSTYANLVQAADRALYAAKEQGRNRTCFAEV
jgi:diguanylate cyclase (GGDEF)-like protein